LKGEKNEKKNKKLIENKNEKQIEKDVFMKNMYTYMNNMYSIKNGNIVVVL